MTSDFHAYMGTQGLRFGALGAYILLIGLVLLWEGWLAPVPRAPTGLWLVLKSLPLLLPLFGLLRGRPRSFLWASLLLLLYFMEGVMLMYVHRSEDFSAHHVLPYALLEVLFSLFFIVAASFYVRSVNVQLGPLK